MTTGKHWAIKSIDGFNHVASLDDSLDGLRRGRTCPAPLANSNKRQLSIERIDIRHGCNGGMFK